MEDKIWILKDSDGNLPTAEEAEEFRAWLTRDKFTPKVLCKERRDDSGKTILCEWRFEASETGRTIAELDQEIAHLRRANNAHVNLLEAVKMAVQANDKNAVRKLLDIED